MFGCLSLQKAFRLYVGIVASAIALIGCESGESEIPNANELADPWIAADTPYNVWITDQTFTGLALSQALAKDENFANTICEQDAGQPSGFSKHVALVSTPSFDRIDAVAKYQLDPNQPINYSDSGRILARNLGDFLAQRATVDPENKDSTHTIKLTLSIDGKFAGFCNGQTDFTPSIRIVRDKPRNMENFTTSCAQPGSVVCLSMK